MTRSLSAVLFGCLILVGCTNNTTTARVDIDSMPTPSREAGLSDWNARTTGATQAIRFGGSDANVVAYAHGDSGAPNVTWNPSGGIIGDGCLRLVRPTGPSSSANWRAPLNSEWTLRGEGFGIGVPFWVQYRFRLGPGRLKSNPGSAGFKISDISQYNVASPDSSRSHTNGEVVTQNQDWRGSPLVYRDIGWTGTPPFVPIATFRLKEGIWYTIMYRLEFPTWSNTRGTGNRFQVWIARPGDTSWTTLYDLSGASAIIGTNDNDDLEGIPNGHNGIWFTTFETNATAYNTATWQEYDQLIVSLAQIPIPRI